MGVFEDLKKKGSSTSSSGGGVFATITKKKQEEETEKKNAKQKELSDSYKAYSSTHNQFDSLDIRQSPTMQNIAKLDNTPPKWNGVLDNPITRTAGRGLNAVGNAYDKVSHLPGINQATGAMQGAANSFVSNDDPVKDEPLWKKYLGNVKDAAHIGQMITNPSLLVTDVFKNKGLAGGAKAFAEAPVSGVKGFFNPDEARKNLEDSLKSKSLITQLAVGSAADPLSYVPIPSIKGIKTASTAVGEAFERFAVRNKEIPATFEQYQQAAKSRNELSLGEIDRGEKGIVDKFNFMEKQMGKEAPLQLPEPKVSTMAREAERRSVLAPSDRTILGRGDVETFALPASNTPRIISDIKKQANAIIKPPTSRRDLLAYTEQHLEIPRTELVEMTDKDLYQLGQMIRTNTNMDALHAKLAAEQGHNWTDLVSGKSVVGNVESPLNRLQFQPNTVKPQPLVGSGGPVETVATPRVRKPKVEPVNGTVTKKESVIKPVTKVEVVKVKADPIVAKPAELKPKVENRSSAATPGIRANYQNQLKNGNFSPELKSKIRNADQSYERATNEETVKKANEAVKDLTVAESNFKHNEKYSAEHVATGYRLIKELDNKALAESNPVLRESLHKRSLDIADKLAKDLTEAGQTVQAASLISKMSPEGQLLNLTRQAANNGKTVSVTDKVKFQELAAKVQKNSKAGVQANQFTEILDRAAKGERLTPDDVKKMSDYLASAEKPVKPKSVKVADDLPTEFKDVRKRDKIVSFLDDAEQAALARIKARKNNLNSLPIGEWADHAIVVSAQIAKGSIKAATHVEDLVKLFGEEIRPVATQVYQKAQSLVKRVSPSVGEGNLTKAQQAFRRLSGEAEKEKAVVQEMAGHVKKLIADSKAGKLDAKDIQKLRDYSDEIAEMTADAKPRELPTQEQRFLQSVKSLSKKIAQVEDGKIPMDQANKDISNILRQITKISEEGTEQVLRAKVDNTHLSNIAHDVMNKTRPNPKPVTLQEKIVEKYLKQQDKDGVVVSPRDIDTLRDLAKNITRLSSDDRISADIAMQKILNSYEKSTPWDKVKAIRYMAMLLNSGTQLVNAASGPIMATTGHVADIFGTMLDQAMHVAFKTPRSTTMYGANPIRFMVDYTKNLLKVGMPAGWHGVNPAGIQNVGEIRGLTFKSNYNPLNWAERTLGAVAKGTDYAAYKTVYDSEIRKVGFLEALNSGIKRSDKVAIKSYVDKFVNEPTEKAMLQADRIGKNTTFQREDSIGGSTANFLNSGNAKVKKYVSPVVNTVVPFIKTPINIASTAVTMTPAGILKGLWQLTSKSPASQREAIRTLSLSITGSAGIGSIGYYLSQLGIITGANDSGDKDVDAIREQAGQGKYRFNTSALKRYLKAWLDGEGADGAEKAARYQEGDHAFDYNKFQPLAFPLATGASLQQNKNKSLIGRVESAGTDAYGSLFGMSTLKGVQDVFQPQYTGSQGEKQIGVASRLAESFFKSFSPSMMAQEARRQDPIARKTPYNNGLSDDVKGYFKSRTPGLSQSLPANKTTLGIDKKNAAGFMGQYVNPYKSEVAAYSSAAVIISDLIDRTGDKSLAPSAPLKNVKFKNRVGEEVTVAIPQDRYEQLQEELGHEIILKITALDPNLSDAKKAERIKDIYAKSRKKEMDKVERELKAAQ